MHIPNARKTPDEIVARNLYCLRTDEEHKGANSISRRRFADRLSEQSGEHWPVQRIIDIEGKRSKRRPPSPATWAELIALAIALQVPVYDLVLPGEDEDVIVAKASDIEVRESADGKKRTKTVSYLHPATRDEFAKLLFVLPASTLTKTMLEKHAALFDEELAGAMLDIQSVKQGLTQALARLEQAKEDS
jgi:hypothetical protein